MKSHVFTLFVTVHLATSVLVERRSGTETCVQSSDFYQTCDDGVCYNEKCHPVISIDEDNCTSSTWTLGKPYADCPNAYDVCQGDECVDGGARKVSIGEQCIGPDNACVDTQFCSSTEGCFPRTLGYFSRGTVCDPDMGTDCVSEYPCRANTDYQVFTCGGTGHIKGIGQLTTDGKCQRWDEGLISYCAEGYTCGPARTCQPDTSGFLAEGGTCGKNVGTCGPGLWCDNWDECSKNPPKTLSLPIISILTGIFAVVIRVTFL